MTARERLAVLRVTYRYGWSKRMDLLCLRLAARMPARLRMWVVVDATNEARRLYPHHAGFAGPDGLEYKHIYDGAMRSRNADRISRDSGTGTGVKRLALVLQHALRR